MFTHLNLHSYYSLGWGVVSPEKICQSVNEMGCKAIAITDTNTLAGMMFFIDYAREFGLRPIVGAELIDDNTTTTLLVTNQKGYSNLCHIITNKHIKTDFNLNSEIELQHDGLVVISDDTRLVKRLHTQAEHLYIALSPGIQSRQLLNLSRELGIKPVAVNRAFWIQREDFELHKLVRTIAQNSTLTDVSLDDLAHQDCILMDENSMRKYFSYCPEAVDNTNEVAELCHWTPNFGVVYPEIESGMNGSAIESLRERAFTGAKWRYGNINDAVVKRLEHELELIDEKGYAPVFLVVEDIVKRTNLTCGRGSAAASIVSYCLGITHVDPIRHKLFFERFINPARTDPPDIDVDFAWDERDEVLDYIFKKYGEENAAMVSNHVSFQRRGAVREVAKVFGLPDAEISAVTKRITYGFKSLGIDLKDHPALADHGFPPPWGEILELSDRLDNIPRYMSVHCGGVVITPGETANWVPTEIAAKGVRIVQWEKDQTEDSGLVKIDVLGNRSLAVIRDTLVKIKKRHGVDIRYNELNPLDDPETQEMIARGETMGVFYVESPATRQLQKKAGVGDFEHLVIHSSIIRPAANPFIHDYLRRLKGEAWEPLHPIIGDVLDETYGIMVYQEDVTKVAMQLAGFDFADGEELRKIISKKHKHRRLLDLRKKFFAGAKERGANATALEKIWDMIMSFAGYSFCKPHSASYALVSFKSAFLRRHYPAEFISSVISNRGGFYATFAYVSEARRMGLRILPPDINESDERYTGTDDWIRIGLMQIKGLAEKSLKKVLEVRSIAHFISFDDFIHRTTISTSDVKLLIIAGCFDRLEPKKTRPQLIWQLLLHNQPRKSGQEDLFTDVVRQVPEPPEYDPKTLLKMETETLGFLASRHPLELYEDELKRTVYMKACDLQDHVGKRITAIGWLVTGKVVSTKNHEPMEFVTFEDTTGLIESTFFPQVFKKFSHILSYTRAYRLKGLVEEDFGAVTLTVDSISFL